ncbi:MAG: LapA family protein [Gaiellaceae bacterium]
MQEEPEQSTPPAAPEEERSDEPKEGFGRQWQPRLYLRIVFLGLLIAYGIAFVLENNKHVHLHFVVGTTQTSLIWLILLSVALGLILGVLLSQLYRRRRRRH